MATKRATEARTEKHRKTHKLAQMWVSPEYWKALHAHATADGRKIANFMRREIGKIIGVAE